MITSGIKERLQPKDKMTRTIETLDTGSGKIDAHRVTETDDQAKEIRTEYVEVFPHGQTDPEEMIAWFGDVASFARWISGAEIVGF